MYRKLHNVLNNIVHFFRIRELRFWARSMDDDIFILILHY